MELLCFNYNFRKINYFIKKIKIAQYNQNKDWKINASFLCDLYNHNKQRFQVDQEIIESVFDWPINTFKHIRNNIFL